MYQTRVDSLADRVSGGEGGEPDAWSSGDAGAPHRQAPALRFHERPIPLAEQGLDDQAFACTVGEKHPAGHLTAVAGHHQAEHEVHHVALDLADWSHTHVQHPTDTATHHGLNLGEPSATPLPRTCCPPSRRRRPRRRPRNSAGCDVHVWASGPSGTGSTEEPAPGYLSPQYRGSRKLTDKIALITGGDSVSAVQSPSCTPRRCRCGRRLPAAGTAGRGGDAARRARHSTTPR